MDPISIAVGAGLKVTQKTVQKLWELYGPEGKLNADWKAITEEVVYETARDVDVIRSRLEDVERQVDALDQDPRLVGMCLRLFQEARESGTRERMRMLCAALARVHVPNPDAETKSRIARAVAQLEPSDVILLRKLAQIERDSRDDDKEVYRSEMLPKAKEASVSAQALMVAGCLLQFTRTRVDGSRFERTLAHASDKRQHLLGSMLDFLEHVDTLQVTDVGLAVVDFLEHWTPEPATETDSTRKEPSGVLAPAEP